MSIQPLILGSGRSGQAIAKSLASLRLLQPRLQIENPIWIERGSALEPLRKKYSQTLLCIANPHGLHADAILEADQAGFDAILCEKPACVNLEQLQKLRKIKTPTAILHVYRQMWGPQTLRNLIAENKLGQIISIEGRYWQASTAERALLKNSGATTKGISQNWKDDPRLSGKYDAYLDVGTHWVDTVSYLYNASPARIQGWRSYANSDSPHRDSHLHLSIVYPNGGRSLGSISKTFHGATNHFEVNIIGTKMSATWEFLKPDEIFLGEGRDRKVFTRKTCELGSMQPPHHGMGWLEGYIEISSRLLKHVFLGEYRDYPSLGDNLDILQTILNTHWQE